MRATWVDVDLGRLAANVQLLRGHLAPGAELAAVVKADAYGHGAVPVARTALEAGATVLAVAFLEEAATLRAAGIEAPILVMGWTPPERAAEVVGQNVDQAVFSVEDARALAAAGRAAGRRARIHAKVDTGMGRLGWPARDDAGQERAAAAIATIAGLPGLELAGVFTHFAGADEPDLTGARRQLAAFQGVLALLEAASVRPRMRHAANSAAILRLPESHLDACRAGIGLYGYADHPGLRPVLSWYTRVAMVKTLAAGEAVSYGGTYVAPAPERVATLPVGYADGWRRALSNRGHVILGGAAAPIRGRVCMDQIIVSCPEDVPARQGDLAVLVGAQGGCAQWADDLAGQLGTISYEVLCAIHPRVPRRHLPA